MILLSLSFVRFFSTCAVLCCWIDLFEVHKPTSSERERERKNVAKQKVAEDGDDGDSDEKCSHTTRACIKHIVYYILYTIYIYSCAVYITICI